MKILQIHNFYQQPGGEDVVFANERDLLRENGHQILLYTIDNDLIHSISSATLVARTFWNRQVFQHIRSLIKSERIDIVHCHNIFPLISPSVYWAANREAVPIVQTVHNYRLICPAATLWREGHPCEDCLRGQSMMPAIAHRCYRNNFGATAVLVGMIRAHGAFGTWDHRVTRYIALTKFMRGKLIEGGIPAAMISVKPNFTTPHSQLSGRHDGYFLFAGRLSPEKGLRTLVEAWARIPHVPLRIAGSGPELEVLRKAADHLPNITILGQQTPAELRFQMRGAQCLVVPSTWYEGFGMVVIEAFSSGTPVLAANHGSLAEIIDDGRTGRLFRPGDAIDLAEKAAWFIEQPSKWPDMHLAARKEFDEKYTPEQNYRLLMDVYQQCLETHRV